MVIAPPAPQPIKFIKPKLNQKQILIVLLLPALIIFLIFYFGFGKKAPRKPIETPAITAPKIIFIEKVELDVDFLKTEEFKELRVFGEIPIKVEKTGKMNPFSP